MSTYTDYLNLFKWDPETDGEEEFDIERALNENWDKLDVKIKQHIINTAQTILEFETQVNQDLQTEKENLASDLETYKETLNADLDTYKEDINTDISTYKETVDAEIADFKNNSFATVEMVNNYISDIYDSSKTYAVGEYCIYDNILYKCITEITEGEAFNSSKWEQTSIAKEFKGIETAILESKTTVIVTESGTDLNDYTEDGAYYFSGSVTPTNIPAGLNGFLQVMTNGTIHKQIWYRHGTNNTNDFETYVRTYQSNDGWSDWQKYLTTKNNLTYSTSEKNTGEIWLDGKPIYQKTIIITSVSSGNNKIYHNISNFNELIDIRGSAYFAGQGWQPIQRIVTDNVEPYGLGLGDVLESTFSMQVGTSYVGFQKAYITLKYTKTS